MFWDKVSKYKNTIKFLKRSQIIARLLRPYKKIDKTPVSELKMRQPKNVFNRIAINKCSMVADDQFVFLNEVGAIGSWNNPNYSKLWLYNLHYFDDLNSVDSIKRTDIHVSLIDKWISENPCMVGNGWEPYPTSLRIVNWIKWFLAYGQITKTRSRSLALQAKVLSQVIEYHLLGNHIFANAKALIFAGLYFEGPNADRWLDKGLKILHRELHEQVLADGGNFELSPMYHAIILADLLDLVSLFEAYDHPLCVELDTQIRSILPKMLNWLSIMTHPDGGCAFFNDSALCIAPTLHILECAAKSFDIYSERHRQQPKMTEFLPNTGYFRMNLRDAMVIGDVAKIGADYIPGHAHADTLSFEASIYNKRFIVNSGTSIYGVCKERLRQRGTASHSTVTIDNQDSSEVWGGFRVARRAHPVGLEIDEKNNVIRCAHDGYTRLKGQPIHTREWRYNKSVLKITDTISGDFNSAEARYHFHPDWACAMQGGKIICSFEELEVELKIEIGKGQLVNTTYHPEFGSSINNQVLVVEINKTLPLVEISIAW